MSEPASATMVTKKDNVWRVLAPLCGAQVFSVLGEQALLATALPLWAYDALASARGSSLALAAFAFPALFSFPAAVAVSRYAPLEVLRASGIARLVSVALLCILTLMPHAARGVSFGSILFLAALVALADSFFMPALKAGVPAWVSQHQLLRANAWLEATDGPGWIAGPLLATMLYAQMGITGPAFLLFLCYAIGLATLLTVPRLPRTSIPQPVPWTGGWVSGIRLLQHTYGRPAFRALFAAWVVGMTAAGLVEASALPFLREILHLPESAWGGFMGLWGVGMVAGAGAWGLTNLRVRSLLIFALCLIVAALSLFALALTTWVSAAAWFFSGIGFVGVHMAASTLLQSETDAQDTMPLLGLTHSLEAGGLLIGLAIGTALTVARGPQATLTLSIAFLVAAVMILWLSCPTATVLPSPVSDVREGN